MHRHRKLLILLAVLAVTATAGVVVYQRVASPSKAILLLPEGNFLLYVNFTPMHFVNLGQPAESDPQYKGFVQETGFHFEHDLNTIAISQRNPGDINSESSAVFTGSFDQARLSGYLKRLAGKSENYADRPIYTIQQGGHTVRACIVDSRTVAVTNMDSGEPMHSIIDKARGIASGNPSLVQDYYRYVPLGSLAWAMFRVSSDPRASQLPGGINVDFLQNTVSILSVRYTGSIRVKAEIVSTNDTDAGRVLQAVNTFLAVAKGAGTALASGGPDKDVQTVFDSIQAQQNGRSTVISVSIPQAVVQKIAAKMNQ